MTSLWFMTFCLLASVQSSQTPSQISLSFGPDGFSSMNVTWVTDNRLAHAELKYGTESTHIVAKVQGSTTFYHFASVANETQGSGGIHHATLTGLEPLTTYYYQVGDVAADVWSDVRSFTTLPAPGSLKDPFSFAVIGDLGQTSDSKTTIMQMAQDKEVRMVVCVGDMAYADTNQTLWGSYGEYVQNISSRIPFMVGPGNHEIESDSKTGFNFVPYEHRYNMPAVGPPIMKSSPGQVGCVHPAQDGQVDCTPSAFMSTYDFGNSFFSYDMANVHVITLNPYTHSDLDSPQGKWVASELASFNRSKTQWLIVSMHCPWYNSNTFHQNEAQAVAMKANMESLFLSSAVDVVITGHVHAYERVYPVAHGETTPSGITYLGVGASGNREGHAGPFEQPSPKWSATRNDTLYGHGKMTVYNDTHLHWVWFANKIGQKVPYDEAWIIRDPVSRKTHHKRASPEDIADPEY